VGSEPAVRKRGYQDTHTLIGSDTHHTDDDHNTCDTGGDPRPAKRRKTRGAPAVNPPLHLQRSPPLKLQSAARPEIDDVQARGDHGCSSNLMDDSQRRASQTSRSPSAATEAAPFAEYQEWPFEGFLKRTKIGDDVTYNLEFKLPSISEYLRVPIYPEALDINHDTATHSKVHQAPLKPKKSKVAWTPEEDATLVQMKNDGCSWEEIRAALPGRSKGTIQVRYSTKFKK
jgi:hypothetical protein